MMYEQHEHQRTNNGPDNEAMLNEIVRNTEMGKNTLDELIHITEDRNLKGSLLGQQREYRKLNQQAHTALAACDCRAKGEAPMKKMMAEMGIKYKTIGDRSNRNLAEMIIEGANMGVVSCEKVRKDHPQASIGAKTMLDELQSFEEQTIEQMKNYL